MTCMASPSSPEPRDLLLAPFSRDLPWGMFSGRFHVTADVTADVTGLAEVGSLSRAGFTCHIAMLGSSVVALLYGWYCHLIYGDN